MTRFILLFASVFLLVPGTSGAATSCSRANLTRCLDSVCAINVSSNPAARCQYCGTVDAGVPAATGMRGVVVGTSAKYNISDKELKTAPTNPAARYAWAAEKCMAKVAGCSEDDVTEVYDVLIEQSCKAAGVAADFKALTDAAATQRSFESCASAIKVCVLSDEKCVADFSGCKSDTDFDSYLSLCAVDATGCDAYTSDIRDELAKLRTGVFENADKVIESIVLSYQKGRESNRSQIDNQCKNNAAHDACVQRACANNMPGKCADESEKAAATELCKFYKIACDTLK